MDAAWLRSLSTQARDSLAGTAAEWDAFERYADETEAVWLDSAGRAIAQGPLADLRDHAAHIGAGGTAHVAAMDAVADDADTFAAARAEHEVHAASFRRAHLEATSDLDQSASDADRATHNARIALAAASDAATIATRLQMQS